MIKPPPSPVKKSLKEKVVTYYDAIFEVRFLYYFLVKTFIPELSKIISSEKKKKKKKNLNADICIPLRIVPKNVVKASF